MTAQALSFTDVREVRHRSVSVTDPGPEEVVVDTTVSAISPGTELLVYRGEVPDDMPADAALETLSGDLSYPTRYGYAAVGEVVASGDHHDEWVGRDVFAFHPHQTRFCVSADTVVPLPEGLSAAEGAMLPTVETATNLVLDGAPRVGERVVVFGAGVVGLTTIRLLATFPLAELVVVEPIERRRERARSFGADRAVHPETAETLFDDREHEGADLVYEVSGQPAALDDAIDVTGYDSRVVVGSWYGSKRAALDLGGSFHRDHVSVTSSQVSTLPPGLRGRWSKDRRLDTAVDRLTEMNVDALVTDRVPFEDAPTAYERLHSQPESTLQVLLTY